MDILNFHRKVIEEIQSLRHEQAETNRLLRDLVKIHGPQYNMTVTFKDGEGNIMGTTPSAPTDNAQVGQVTIGFPAETVTNPNTGVTGQYSFNFAHIVWAIADPTVASFTVDATTGQATFTALAVGSTTGTVTDSDTSAGDTYDVVVTAASQPNTYALTVAFQPNTS